MPDGLEEERAAATSTAPYVISRSRDRSEPYEESRLIPSNPKRVAAFERAYATTLKVIDQWEARNNKVTEETFASAVAALRKSLEFLIQPVPRRESLLDEILEAIESLIPKPPWYKALRLIEKLGKGLKSRREATEAARRSAARLFIIEEFLDDILLGRKRALSEVIRQANEWKLALWEGGHAVGPVEREILELTDRQNDFRVVLEERFVAEIVKSYWAMLMPRGAYYQLGNPDGSDAERLAELGRRESSSPPTGVRYPPGHATREAALIWKMEYWWPLPVKHYVPNWGELLTLIRSGDPDWTSIKDTPIILRSYARLVVYPDNHSVTYDPQDSWSRPLELIREGFRASLEEFLIDNELLLEDQVNSKWYA